MSQAILSHYAQPGVRERVLAALAAAGHELTLDGLAAIDEFHVRGRDATADLGHALGLGAGMHVLDVGCGIGGPLRRLASVHGCQMTGVDLVFDYCALAQILTERVGLAALAKVCCASALAMPFSSASFDVAYTQHVAMNIADKPALYAEVARVLRPGGRFGIYDLLQGEGGEALYPVPWSRSPATSFLVSASELRGHLERAGFEIVAWRDTSVESREWFARQQRRQREAGPPRLSPGVLLGDDFPVMVQNLARNIAEARVIPTLVIARTRK